MRQFGLLLTLAAANLLLCLPASVRAQQWPTRVIKLVVPFTPGGITDSLARLTGERLEKALKRPVIIENMPGAAGTRAAAYVARTDDDHVLFFGTLSQITVAPFTHKISYDPIKDFQPVSIIGSSPFVITIGPAIPATTLTEFIAFAKSKPGEIAYASAGVASLAHIGAALFARSAGLQMNHVPYKGFAPAMQDLWAGHVGMLTPTPVELKSFLNGKVLKPLAITDKKRSQVVPAIPAITEFLQMPRIVTWNGVLAGRKTPAAAITLLSQEIMAAERDPVFLDRLSKIGVEPVVHTPQEFARLIASDMVIWKRIVEDIGLKAVQ